MLIIGGKMANSLYYLLFKTAHTQRKKNIPFLKELNLATGQPKVLRYLYEQNVYKNILPKVVI